MTQDGGIYVLVFDPDDPQSRSAYLMAQAIVRSEAAGSVGAIGTRGTRDSLGTPGTPDKRDETPGSNADSRVTPGTSGAASSSIDRDRETLHDTTSKSSGMGERVKITGRVIERDGLLAIAVQKVERQYEDSTASIPTSRGNQ